MPSRRWPRTWSKRQLSDPQICRRRPDLRHESKVDLVILCNVLHEVDPWEWIRKLKEICRILHDDGFLLVMEDQEMGVGELPNETGFIVPDVAELQHLFGSLAKVCPLPGTRGSRCSATLIQQSALKELVTLESSSARVREVLIMIKERMIEDLRRIRAHKNHSHKEGRANARTVMMLANVILALENLSVGA